MPEISRFFGIIIMMYFDDHCPAHFHVKYNEFRAKVSINDLRLIEGELPRRVLAMTLEWANEHRSELLENWETIGRTGDFKKVKPLE
ncbi:MAG: DUF4160 domain-containing protein [Candidatus Wallbacteria bacterium]|nr:DUF4160 domain-containing protein [Candidatus Wallbacteria bacterium]